MSLRRHHNSEISLPRALLVIVFGFTFICQSRAHEGPPYAILVDKTIGPCLVSVWADPDVGIGTFFIILEPLKGAKDAAVPNDVVVEIGVRPLSGRLPEVRYKALRMAQRGQVQYKAEVNFDTQEQWSARILLHSSHGNGEASVEIEVTPPGYGRWDLLLYLFPFVAVGFLWLKAFLRGRSRNKTTG